MKLTDVARASLGELRGDYEVMITDREQLPWSVHSAEAQAINSISLDHATFTGDVVHESAKHALIQRKKYARWLDAKDPVVVANAMLIIITRALNMLKSQIEARGKAFQESGGFSERLTAKRLEARDQNRGKDAPECPQCGQAMRQRQSAKGPFWGCAAYPDCKGTRPMSDTPQPEGPC